ncbi:guanylate kinase [Butyrivibrio sp. MC2013]|uniref:guanylate kinase n=1 Tax=Butyrivibrio sp. MC2013 TaxID=1280686 RepID=UPI0003F5605D|nr:guanylate kinase [Butyrivibrio sp. MC2013]
MTNENNRKGVIVVVSGFSGTGKGTLMKKLVEEYDNYALSVSATTRQPRPGEENGREYFFISDEEFEKLIEEDGLLEHAGYCGHYYGTPRKYVEDCMNEGKDVILEIEIQGARQIKKQYPDAVLLFVMPPSAEVLEQRLRGRGTETDEVIKGRLRRATEEAEGIEEYDYILINDDLDTCLQDMRSAIESAHLAPCRQKDFIEKIRRDVEQFK